MRLDDYLGMFTAKFPKGQAMVMKMDIEGHECQAIAGMTEFLKYFKLVFVLMEWYDRKPIPILLVVVV